ncbi:ArsR/SmtB family transcription factor [Paralcaligenes ureilyticus]|uniref:ArsR family transcriptional regulator n=1 Tax=Paralcaligenes ureilyticus TaxID=627131 RepID=A0A4R3M1P8_9BURK|nr:metalloregulator ArsR/SmtB family transcription factor [Paralcaligenes ureilyticus]TCT07054.1 ArsR family transcriptional regulator [Paralcaligenes ureilyticus]
METMNVITALSALAQESRLAVFRLLVQAGPQGLAATKIAEALELAPSSLSFHLKELTYAKLIRQVREGRSLIYSVNFETMNGVLGFLTENCCGGNPCTPVCLPQCSNEGVSS